MPSDAPDPSSSAPIPALVNVRSGTAEAALGALEADARFAVRRVEPGEMRGAVEEAVRGGARRLLVAGGDGSIATAASVLAGTDVELAVARGGTLNHFARDLRIPANVGEALDLAATGTPRSVDVGRAGERLFLNTASVGAYVAYVRTRERLRWLGYALASAAAALATLARLPALDVELTVDGETRRLRTPELFLGVGERETEGRRLGVRRAGGHRGLHLLVATRPGRLRLLRAALHAVLPWGETPLRTGELEGAVASECELRTGRPAVSVGLDGEVVRMPVPLVFRIERDALHVVAPRDAGAGRG